MDYLVSVQRPICLMFYVAQNAGHQELSARRTKKSSAKHAA